ncbi:Uncharacterised protein [Escherichia coli]|uniref:Uncharacterized protein n=1 Tax=Escherichia coli TaxID=562 RepID=A0A376S844_ECOLX|nr:Uncharacterised protein [Escherichia coli]
MRILDKEDWRVIANKVKNTLFGIEFGGKATDITHGIGRASTTLNGREPYKYWVILFGSERKSALVISLKLLYGWK